jgi:predicted nuclease with TOPRIM domain
MTSRGLVKRATRDYEALGADNKSLRRKLANRRRTELNICQGNCFNDLEEADHRNWEKGQEIDSLKASIAVLQSQVEVLNGVIAKHDENCKDRCEENIQLRARIQELEQQVKKRKTVSFAAGTK